MRFSELAEKRVAVWGYGREGQAALTALSDRLPAQEVKLLCTPAEAEQAKIRHDNLKCIVDEPDVSVLRQFDVVIKSPGISAYKPAVLEAKKAGINIISGTALWFSENPAARVIAVTGTKGKSTTSALIAHLLRQLGRRTALAGNIGMPLLELLNPPSLPDWWVVELSSFQTNDVSVVPDIAVVLNLYQEHLDWHGSLSQYHADKLALLNNDQRTCAVLNAGDSILSTLDKPLRKVWFNHSSGWHIENSAIYRGTQRVFELAAIPLPGTHNALNVCAALAAIETAGEDVFAATSHIGTFRALPHRLQALGKRDGVTWVNDSISTTPQATLEAMASLQGQAVTVLVGGFDRGVDWQRFAEAVKTQPPHAIITMGANGGRIADLLLQVGGNYQHAHCATLAEAVHIAKCMTPLSGVILLSPGAPSFDQFQDYAERGRVFAVLGGFNSRLITEIDGLGVTKYY